MITLQTSVSSSQSLAENTHLPLAENTHLHDNLRDDLPKRWHFSIDDYYALATMGILPQHGSPRTELVEGEIFTMRPLGGPHIWAVSRITHKLSRIFAERIDKEELMLINQGAVRLPNDSEPEPDIALIRYTPGQDESRVPDAADVALIIEVADSSLLYDRTKKAKIYAQADIADYWIVNLHDNSLEVYRQPHKGKYTDTSILHREDSITLLAFPDTVISLTAFFK